MLVALLLALFIGLLVLLLVIIFAGPAVAKSDLGASCTDDQDCAPGLTCLTGTCKAEINEPCRVFTDCVAAATACYQGRCVAEPLGGPGEPGPCRAGLGLEYNMCRGLGGSSCTGDGMCFSGLVCHNGTCQSAVAVAAHRERELQEIRSREEELRRQHELARQEEQRALEARQAEIAKAQAQRAAREAQQFREENTRTLVLLDPYENKCTDILRADPEFDVDSAAFYGALIVMATSQGETRVYDTSQQRLIPIKIKERVHSLTTANGFVTGLNEANEVIQFRQEVIHSDGSTEWTAQPLNITGRVLHASPDGHYLVTLTQEHCYIFDALEDPVKPVHSFPITPEVREVIVNDDLRNIMVVTDRGIQMNDTRLIPAHYGCFTGDGRFATVPKEANYIHRSYISNGQNYNIVRRRDINKLLE